MKPVYQRSRSSSLGGRSLEKELVDLLENNSLSRHTEGLASLGCRIKNDLVYLRTKDFDNLKCNTIDRRKFRDVLKQIPGSRALSPLSPVALSPSQYGKKIHVSLSVDKYPDGNLSSCSQDANSLFFAFTQLDPSFERFQMEDADVRPGDVRKLFLSDLYPNLDESDLLIVSVHGHGDMGPGGLLYLRLSTVSGEDPFVPGNNLLIKELKSWLSMLPCNHVLLIVDTCFSGLASVKRGKAPAGQRAHCATGLRNKFTIPEDVSRVNSLIATPCKLVLTAGTLKQLVQDGKKSSGEGSPFTESFVKEIKEKDSIREIFVALRNHVFLATGGQMPTLGQLEGDAGGDIFLKG